MNFPLLECMTVGGNDPNKRCVFPFQFTAKPENFTRIYESCTFDFNHPDENKAVCATVAEPEGPHQTGVCGPSCPQPAPSKSLQLKLTKAKYDLNVTF